jgi:hypothetical protein
MNIKEVREEIAQEIFVSLWGKRWRSSLHGCIFIRSSEVSELLTCSPQVRSSEFRILSYIHSGRVRKEYAANFALFSTAHLDNSNEEIMYLKDPQYSMMQAYLNYLKNAVRPFVSAGWSMNLYLPIAERMNISKRTVENYLSQALKHCGLR